jgi:hypothetical protein
MALNPIAFTERVIEDFLRYRLNTYPNAGSDLGLTRSVDVGVYDHRTRTPHPAPRTPHPAPRRRGDGRAPPRLAARADPGGVVGGVRAAFEGDSGAGAGANPSASGPPCRYLPPATSAPCSARVRAYVNEALCTSPKS